MHASGKFPCSACQFKQIVALSNTEASPSAEAVGLSHSALSRPSLALKSTIAFCFQARPDPFHPCGARIFTGGQAEFSGILRCRVVPQTSMKLMADGF